MTNILEPYFNGKKCATSNSIYVNGLIVYENKDDWVEIVKNSNLIKKLNLKEIKIAISKLKLFSVNETVLEYYQTKGILENSTTKINSYVCYYLVNDLTLGKLMNEILRDLTYGKRVTFVINSIEKSQEIIQQFKLINQCFQDGIFNLIIKNGLKLESEVLKLSIDTNLKSLSAFVVFRESDFISAIESLPIQLNARNYKSVLFFVQESQLQVVKEIFDQLWSKIEPKFPKYVYELINYNLDTVLDNDYDQINVGNKINLLAYRDKFEIVKMLNHCPNLLFVSIWSKNLETFSYLADKVNTSNLFWLNSVCNYSPYIPLLDSNSNELLSKDLFIGDCINLNNEESMNFKILENFLTKKLIKLQSYELIDLIVSCLLSDFFPEQINILKYLNSFNQNLIKLEETKDGIYTTKHYPIGFVLVYIDTDDNILELWNLIVSCILSSNVVYLSIKNNFVNTTIIKKFIDVFSDPYFKNMVILDESGVYIDQKLKPIIKYNRKHLGTLITYSKEKNNVNFRNLEHKLFTCKTMFKPYDVLNNTV